MEFITKGDTIHCIRIIRDRSSGKEIPVNVITFNAKVDRVPPHVAANLSLEEVKDLALWLEDRTKLKSRLERQPIENTILESLPVILQQSTQALKDVEQLDFTVFSSIKERLEELSQALENFQHFTSTSKAELKQMKNSEEQKERLYTIKKNIEND